MERRLAAIFSTDVQGYSRLMGDDEEATVRTLTAYREILITLIEDHRGRVVDSPGDNLLAEFASVVDAVQSAVAIQRELANQNTALPPHRQMHFRIGINLGDILVDGERIYGDGVNIAARVESLAEAGGICLSGTAYDQVHNKLNVSFVSLGEHTVKNISEPVRIYQVQLGSQSPPPSVSGAHQSRQKTWQMVVALVALVLILAGGTAIWRFYLRPASSPADLVSETKPALPLPSKPAIAVLPFANLSGDPEQDYFSDGITEDLITVLAKNADLFVIARQTVFTYKGKTVSVQKVGRELGVRYVLEGSVQRAAERVRITAQLVEATTGHHIWADRYDRALTDLFAVQDEVTRHIVGTLLPHMYAAEQATAFRIPTDNLRAYDHVQRGIVHYRTGTREGILLAEEHLTKAIDLDPNYAEAYAWLGWTYDTDYDRGLTGRTGPETPDQIIELHQKALAVEPNLALAHLGIYYGLRRKGRHAEALIAVRKAVELKPNDADYRIFLALAQRYSGRYEAAIVEAETALRLNPRPHLWYFSIYAGALRATGNYLKAIEITKTCLTRAPTWLFCASNQGSSLYAIGQYDQAVEILETCLGQNAKFVFCRLWLAATLSRLQQHEKAQEQIEIIKQLRPGYSLEKARQRYHPIKDVAMLTQFLDDLRQAGLQ